MPHQTQRIECSVAMLSTPIDTHRRTMLYTNTTFAPDKCIQCYGNTRCEQKQLQLMCGSLTMYGNSCTLGEINRQNSQQINHTKICKNHDKCEFGQSFRKIIDASENPIYIHGLIDRIFNTATKPQKLFYLRVILSTCFSAIFSFLTYPKKSLILFYVPVTEYIYIYVQANQTDRIFQYRHIKETWSCQKHTCVNIC